MFNEWFLPDVLQALANVAAVLGIPAALFVYIQEKRRERIEREYGTYHALDEKYIEYLGLCLQYPELDMYGLPLEDKAALTPQQAIQQYALFEILVSILERAFLMYRDQSTRVKRTQWSGWQEFIADWCARQNFRALWKLLGEGYDREFVAYMEGVMAGLES